MSPLEEMIRAIVREEIAKTAPQYSEPEPLLCTVPEASRVTSIGPDTIRSWIADGRLPKRTKNLDPNPKRPVFLVSLSEVREAASGQRKPTPPAVNLAAHRLAERLK